MGVDPGAADLGDLRPVDAADADGGDDVGEGHMRGERVEPERESSRPHQLPDPQPAGSGAEHLDPGAHHEFAEPDQFEGLEVRLGDVDCA
nr:hypothetical protein [Tessaracoccus defluvii]